MFPYKTKEFDDVDDELEFTFNHYFKSRRWVLMPADKGWRPLTDVYETDEEIVIVMDIAGITTKSISVSLHKNILIIRGIRREHIGLHKRHFHKMEIDFGPFERRIELPVSVDPDNATSRYIQGFLEIHLPKKETQCPDTVEIEIR